jgi:glycosyltransferase involved in cell wall biosynthesis
VRVLHVVEAFGGGLQEIVVRVAERCTERGHEAAIAFGRRPETPADPREVVPPSVELEPMPWTRRTPEIQLAATRRLRGLVHSWRPDVVHLYSSFAGMAGAIALGNGPPTVFSPQSFASAQINRGRASRAALRLLERFICARAALVGACSPSEAAYARERLGAKRITLVENGIAELDAPAPRRERRPQPRVIATGRLIPQRRPEACARILARISAEAEVAWVGGPGDASGEQALNAAGIPVTGWLPRDAAVAEVERATVYLHWTAGDGQALSVLEAMAHDVVVVASDIPPNRDLLAAEQLRDDEEGAIELIRRVLSDPETARRLLESQRRRAAQHGARRMADGWIDVYESIAADRNPTHSIPTSR